MFVNCELDQNDSHIERDLLGESFHLSIASLHTQHLCLYQKRHFYNMDQQCLKK